MITYEQLPPSAQKAYNFTNKLRTVTMFAGLIVSLGLTIWGLFDVFSGNDTLISVVGGCFTIGGLIHGMIHMEFAFKWAKAQGILGIIIGIFVFAVGYIFGGLFLIIDLVLFILKKPRIYPFEVQYFLYN